MGFSLMWVCSEPWPKHHAQCKRVYTNWGAVEGMQSPPPHTHRLEMERSLVRISRNELDLRKVGLDGTAPSQL